MARKDIAPGNATSLVRIRHCKEDDMEQILAIDRVSFPKPHNPSSYHFSLQNNPGGFIIAETNGTIIGYSVTEPFDRRGIILWIAVDPRYRRKGIGTLLMQWSEYLLRRCDYIEVQVRVSNLYAQRLYHKLGFSVIGEIPGYYRGEDGPYGENALIMRRFIYHPR